jgi:hypothetical protein
LADCHAGWCEVRWLCTTGDGDDDNDSCRFHHLAPLSAESDGKALRLHFDSPQRAVTPGQAIVLYGPVETHPHGQTHDRDAVVAAATIASVGKTLHETGTSRQCTSRDY